MIFYVLVLIAIGGAAWIRLAPSDPADWNVDPMVSADQDLATGVRRRIGGGPETMAVLHRIILETPRTEVLAGSLDEGKITYVTRSRIMGFPDYTTLKFETDHLELWARLRFGASDTGVNKARVEGWLARLNAEAAS